MSFRRFCSSAPFHFLRLTVLRGQQGSLFTQSVLLRGDDPTDLPGEVLVVREVEQLLAVARALAPSGRELT